MSKALDILQIVALSGLLLCCFVVLGMLIAVFIKIWKDF